MNRQVLYSFYLFFIITNTQAQTFFDAWVISASSPRLLVEQTDTSTSFQHFSGGRNRIRFWTYKDDCQGFYFSTDLNVVIDHNNNHREVLDSLSYSGPFSLNDVNGGLIKYPYKDSAFAIIFENNFTSNTEGSWSLLNFVIFMVDSSENGFAVMMENKNIDSARQNSTIIIPHVNNEDQWILTRSLEGKCRVRKFTVNGLDSSFLDFDVSPSSPFEHMSHFYPSENGNYIFYESQENEEDFLCIASFDRHAGVFSEIKKYNRALIDSAVPDNYLTDLIFLDSVNILYATAWGDNGVIQIQFDDDFNILGRHKILDPSHIEIGFAYLYHNQLRLGRDGRIYVGNRQGLEKNPEFSDSVDKHFSIIERPYVFGPGCNFNPLVFSLGDYHRLNPGKLAHSGTFQKLQREPSIIGECVQDSILLFLPSDGCKIFQKWLVDFPDGQSLTLNESESRIYASQEGVYTIRLITDQDTLVTRREIKESTSRITNVDTIICKGNSIMLGFPERNHDVVYTWQDNSYSSSITVNAPGIYSLSMNNKCGLEEYTYNVSMNEIEIESGTIQPYYCDNQEVSIHLNESSFQYQLIDTDQDIDKISETGNYRMHIFNQCIDTVIEFNVEITEDIFLEGINVFTPNGDGYNDYFKPYSENINPEGFFLTIYNRWGRKVFETSDPREYWDGSRLDNNTYFYKLEYQDCSGNIIVHKGFVELIR